jgi:hypothetical protein
MRLLPIAALLVAVATASGGPPDFAIGGVGGAYFLAEPGELTVELEKRDRNRRGRPTELRAILFGPDRKVLQEVTIPDDGQGRGSGIGEPQRVVLSTHVPRKSVYGLNVTVSRDRYGDDIIWGFRTNCPKYLIETSRGHRDERHQEPIVLLAPDRPGNICFQPRKEAFDIDINGLPVGVAQLSLFDGKGEKVTDLAVTDDGQVSATIPADVHREARPWRLFFPRQQATVNIDGVTRWNGQDAYPNLSYWSPDLSSFFPFQDYRWLLTPYNRKVHGAPGETVSVPFRVHNNSRRDIDVRLDLEFAAAQWPATLSHSRVAVPRGREVEVTVECVMPAEGEHRSCRVAATPLDESGFTTYSSLAVHATPAAAEQPLKIPLQLHPYAHENRQFGHVPDFPVTSQFYFDGANRPFVASGNLLSFLEDGEWHKVRLRAVVVDDGPDSAIRDFGAQSPKIAFDQDNGLYLLGRSGRDVCLLHSGDGGRTFTAHRLPGRESEPRSFDLEQFSGHTVLDGPPPVVRVTRTAADPNLIWRRVNDLELFVPRKTGHGIRVGDPIRLSRACIGLSMHSGAPSSVVSRDDCIHVVWAEATDPKERVPGVPTYVTTYDRTTGRSSEPSLVGYGPPANDIHNTPSITMDSRGFLHVLAGTHGSPFPYAMSKQPNDSSGGWSEPQPIGDAMRTTYIGLVCGPNDSLHLVCRMWRDSCEPFPASYHAALTYFRKPAGEPWQQPRPLVLPPFSEYSVFYHRLTIDREGQLFLSYDYWSTFWFYRTDHRGNRRTVLMSPDNGETWMLPRTGLFRIRSPSTAKSTH